jgi:hypothetical protein
MERLSVLLMRKNPEIVCVRLVISFLLFVRLFVNLVNRLHRINE